MSETLPHATLREVLGWILRRYDRLRVTGNSMIPLLSPGEEILIDPRAYRVHYPQPDDLVVAVHPYRADLLLIKRVRWVEADGRCYLQGENIADSTDSRQFGLIPLSLLRGKVRCRFP